MSTIRLSVQDNTGKISAATAGDGEVWLVYKAAYASGDRLCVESDTVGQYFILQFDTAIAPAFVYCNGSSFTYPVPFGEARKVFPEYAFAGKRHYLHVRTARPEEIAVRKNLALNPWATHDSNGLFPYASANVETRGEMVFAAKNAIDGMKANSFHGEWPYTSWGINQDPQAAWRLEFGRTVEVDEVVLYLRADFPHDAWWKEASLHFSDGSSQVLSLKKTAAGQRFFFPARQVEWVVLDSLVKADDPSPFPALTQLELWGRDVVKVM